MAYTFEFTCGYMGCIEYAVYGDGTPRHIVSYRIEWRRQFGDYERSITNTGGDPTYIARMIEPTIGKVCRASDARQPIPADVLEAFNAWRLAKHEADMAHMKAHPERYGDFARIEAEYPPPAPLAGIHLKDDISGWLDDEAEPHAQAA